METRTLQTLIAPKVVTALEIINTITHTCSHPPHPNSRPESNEITEIYIVNINHLSFIASSSTTFGILWTASASSDSEPDSERRYWHSTWSWSWSYLYILNLDGKGSSSAALQIPIPLLVISTPSTNVRIILEHHRILVTIPSPSHTLSSPYPSSSSALLTNASTSSTPTSSFTHVSTTSESSFSSSIRPSKRSRTELGPSSTVTAIPLPAAAAVAVIMDWIGYSELDRHRRRHRQGVVTSYSSFCLYFWDRSRTEGLRYGEGGENSNWYRYRGIRSGSPDNIQPSHRTIEVIHITDYAE